MSNRPPPLLPKSKELLENRGWLVWKTEQWVPLERPTGKKCGACKQDIKTGPPGIRRDLFNLADLMAIKEGEKPLWIQVLPLSTWTQHWAKAREQEAFLPWLAIGRFQFHCWRKIKVKNRERWVCLIREPVYNGVISLKEFDLSPAEETLFA